MRFKYDQEPRGRVVRMFAERREEAPEESRSVSYRHLQESTAIRADTMRVQVDEARIDTGGKVGLTASERAEIEG